ncbi:MAG TPA: ATP-binding cassette domain-containing protein [Kineosporiaceae bacterium]|nr:ATP-binding cassette domain-containing protein [Kineosporiaceae bacterium]
MEQPDLNPGHGPQQDRPDTALPQPSEDTQGDPALPADVPDLQSPPSPTPQPLAVDADRLGLHGRERWVFREVGVRLPVGAVLAVIGAKGSGRSSLLLTLAGRMRATDGRLSVLGYSLPRQARQVRERAAVARVGRAVALEPGLTVAETVRERSLLDVVSPDLAAERFGWACSVLGLDLHGHGLVEDLSGLEQTQLACAVAAVGAPSLLLLDDVDAGLHSHEESAVWRGLRGLADSGVSVVAATTDPGPAGEHCDAVLRLAPAVETTKGHFR